MSASIVSASRRKRRKSGLTIIRSAPVRLSHALTDDGAKVSGRRLAQRIGFLLDLVTTIGTEVISSHWNEQDLLIYLQPGQDSFAHKAMTDTFGQLNLRSNGYMPSRVGYMALETVGRTLRSCGHRYDVLRALLRGDDSLLPTTTDAVSMRNLRRAIRKFEKENGRRPLSLFELEPEHPRIARHAILAAVDKQFCEMDGDRLKIRLPLVADPQKPSDWAWHDIAYRTPTHISGDYRKPTLRVVGARVLADIPFEREIEPLLTTTPGCAIGYDWGSTTPLVGSVTWLMNGKPVTDGRELRLKADGLLGKLHRIGAQIETLTAKIEHCSKTLGIRVDTEPEDVEADNSMSRYRATVWIERKRVSCRYHNLLREFAHQAARWAVEQAVARGADTIVLEDLRTMEPDLSGYQNRRVNLALRGKIAELIAQKAQTVGIRLLTVNPRGTSANCSRCGEKTRHYIDSTKSKPGYRWMICPSCGVSLDRDHASSERIGGLGLSPSSKAVTRIILPFPSRPNPLTLPARGQRSKHRRLRLSNAIEAQHASSVVTPHVIDEKSPVRNRPAGPGTDAIAASQSPGTDNLSSHSAVRRPPRTLDGMRSALLGMVKCSPIFDMRLVYPQNQVTTG